MVQDGRSNNAWLVWTEALAFRQHARETAMSADEFGPQETEKYELQNAGITGQDNPRTYELEPYGGEKGKEPIDYREVDPRFA
jgi:hypothetical protein